MSDLLQQLDSIGTQSEEYRIFGPPGTGKTTHLSRQIRRAVDRWGAESVLVTSFSRAAAAELVGRDLPLPRERIGTLHAHCYRALGRPALAEKRVKDWNNEHPEWAMSGATETDIDDPTEVNTAQSGGGDDLLAECSRWRNRMLPVGEWPDMNCRRFYRTWTEWKNSHGLLDFTDLLETAHRDIRIAPGIPRVIFADEAQDFTRLQLSLIRKWGNAADYFVIVGDDDQTIYSFTGATPDAFLKPEIPQERKIVLSQSYRVPIAVHEVAQRWIEQVVSREPKTYQPTSEQGAVDREQNFKYAYPAEMLQDIEGHVAEGRSVMLLATCSYMLQKIRAALIEAGLPFHNPYRRNRGDWNPFGGRGTSARDRVLAYLVAHQSSGEGQRAWTCGEFSLFAEWMRSEGSLNRGVKKLVDRLPDDSRTTIDDLQKWLTPAAYDDLMITGAGDLGGYLKWWLSRVKEAHLRTAAFPCTVATARGVEALHAEPKVVIGTIHSVKGGEADVVYLFPDLSRAGAGQWEIGGEHRDAIVRLMYVGMTRARQRLVICGASGAWAVEGL